MATVTDPVCGMQIERSQAVGQAMHEGQAYFFCSEACRVKFVENPEEYVNKQHEPPGEPIPLP